jgi:hypothetical protein
MTEKKRALDAMQLNIYNNVHSTTEEEKERILEKRITHDETAIKVVEKDILVQSESLKKRLAARQKSREVTRSMSTLNKSTGGLSHSLSLNFNFLKHNAEGHTESGQNVSNIISGSNSQRKGEHFGKLNNS